MRNGGNGKEIFNRKFKNLIKQHITGWNKTHFLSFSSDKKRALYYGNWENKEYVDIWDDYDNWDFVILKFDTTQLLNIKKLETGIYKAEYLPTCREFLPKFKLILIDTLSYLTKNKELSNPDYSIAIKNAKKDKEWLILPASPFGNEGELTSKLDTNCITGEYFEFV